MCALFWVCVRWRSRVSFKKSSASFLPHQLLGCLLTSESNRMYTGIQGSVYDVALAPSPPRPPYVLKLSILYKVDLIFARFTMRDYFSESSLMLPLRAFFRQILFWNYLLRVANSMCILYIIHSINHHWMHLSSRQWWWLGGLRRSFFTARFMISTLINMIKGILFYTSTDLKYQHTWFRLNTTLVCYLEKHCVVG